MAQIPMAQARYARDVHCAEAARLAQAEQVRRRRQENGL